MNIEQKIDKIVKKYIKNSTVKIMEGDGTIDNAYHIIVFSINIEEFEHTVCNNGYISEVMNVHAVTRQITKEINDAGVENFRLYMVPKWY